jgi:hypothetical protein
VPLVAEKVVILSRHGIRTPYAPADGFDYASLSTDARVWPAVAPTPDPMWGAVFNGTADLTTHGAAVLESHGAYYARETWIALVQQQQGGSQAGGDPCSQVTFYADPDPDTHRDRETARHFLRGMLPQCDPDAVVQNNRELRAVFNQGAPSHFTARLTPAGCPSMPPKTVVDGAVTGNDIQKFTQAQGEMIRALSDAVGCCKAEVCAAHGATPDWARTGAASSPTHAGPSPADASSLATLDLDAGPYLTGVPLVVTYSHATDAHNWVGLYRARDTPGREEDWSHHWDYVPSPGTGTVRFTATVAGRYYLTMFAGGSATLYTELTERLYIEVHDGPQSVGPAGSNASLAGLRVGAGPHVAGRPLTVTFTGATDGHDWVGIYKDGHTPGDQQPGEWHYHGSVAGSGSVMVTPTSAGRYFIVLFCCNGFLEKTGRLEITVKAPCSLLDLNTPSTAQFNPVHFWSLYNGTLALSASIAEYLQLLYLNGMDARAVAPGMSEAEIARFVEVSKRSPRSTDKNAPPT